MTNTLFQINNDIPRFYVLSTFAKKGLNRETD